MKPRVRRVSDLLYKGDYTIPVVLDDGEIISIGIIQLFSEGYGIGAEVELKEIDYRKPERPASEWVKLIKPSFDITLYCECGEELNSSNVRFKTLRCLNRDCSKRERDLREAFKNQLGEDKLTVDRILEDPKFDFFNVLDLFMYRLKNASYSSKDIEKMREALNSRNLLKSVKIIKKCMGTTSKSIEEELSLKLSSLFKILNEDTTN